MALIMGGDRGQRLHNHGAGAIGIEQEANDRRPLLERTRRHGVRSNGVEGLPELDRRMPAVKLGLTLSQDRGVSDFRAHKASPSR